MKRSLYLLLSILSPFLLNSQHINILIDDVAGMFPPSEPSIIIDPNNTNHLAAGSIINNAYFSTDGGLTWSKEELTSTYGVWGDPALIVDKYGSYYYFHLSNPPAGNWIDRIVCQKADIVNGNWNDGTYMGLNGTKAQDKQWAAVDMATNTIYVTWTQFDEYGSSSPNDFSDIYFSKSTDGAQTWSPALRINQNSGDCIDSDNTVEGAVPSVGPNGEVYVGWVGPDGLVFDRSLDGGETWLEEDIFVTSVPGGWDYSIPGIYRCNGLPVTLCDTSGGPYHGRVYMNWTDQRNGSDDTDVWLITSDDGGNTWGEPIRVNDDPAGKHQFFTWMAIDQTNGNLYFVFYDRRNYNNTSTDVYMAMSTDGGFSFTNFKISETPFLPTSGIFFGDYTNITAHDGVVRPIWARLHNSQMSIYTAIVDLGVVGLPEPMSLATLEQNYPNPFQESTAIAFKLLDDMPVTLDIVDAFGRTVARIYNGEQMVSGKYIYHFDSSAYSLPPGVYCFSLVAGKQNIKRKMLLL